MTAVSWEWPEEVIDGRGQRWRVGQRRARARSWCLLLALVFTASMVAPRAAWTADPAEIETLIREGVDLRRAGKDGQAITVFHKAFDLDRTPRTAGQLGLCELALGYWVDGETHLIEALASPSHPWVQRNRQALEAALENARGNLGDVVVTAHPNRGELMVDERRAAQLPLGGPVRLSRGNHVIEIHLDGYQSGSLQVMVPGGDRQSIEITQHPVSAGAAGIAAPSASAGLHPEPATSSTPTSPGTDDGAADKDSRAPLEEAPASDPRRRMGWVTAGVGALALGFGVFQTTVWVGKAHDFNDHVGPLASNPMTTGLNCGNDEPDSGGPGCSAVHASLTQARTWAIVGYGAGAALEGLAVYLFLTSPVKDPGGVALACAPGLTTAGLTCVVAF
jgi:hypothetical protein